MKTFLKSILGLLCILIPGTVWSQITISPTNIFVSEQSPFATYLVINGSNQPQEISISFSFGYSIADSAGNRQIVYEDSSLAAGHSAADWIRAFPRNFVVSPGQRQTVRLRIQAPQGLEDGVYWTRVKTLATPQSPPVEIQSNDAVTARVEFNLQQVTGLYYKVGDVSTGIEISELDVVQRDNGFVQLLADLERTGNSPFLGTINARILNNNNQVVRTSTISTTIFFSGAYKQEIGVDGLEPGSYKVQLEFLSERGDIPKENLVQMQPATKTVTFRLK